MKRDYLVFMFDSRANLLVDGLLKFFIVEDGPDLAIAVAGPVGGAHLDLGLAYIRPEIEFEFI